MLWLLYRNAWCSTASKISGGGNTLGSSTSRCSYITCLLCFAICAAVEHASANSYTNTRLTKGLRQEATRGIHGLNATPRYLFSRIVQFNHSSSRASEPCRNLIFYIILLVWYVNIDTLFSRLHSCQIRFPPFWSAPKALWKCCRSRTRSAQGDWGKPAFVLKDFLLVFGGMPSWGHSLKRRLTWHMARLPGNSPKVAFKFWSFQNGLKMVLRINCFNKGKHLTKSRQWINGFWFLIVWFSCCWPVERAEKIKQITYTKYQKDTFKQR